VKSPIQRPTILAVVACLIATTSCQKTHTPAAVPPAPAVSTGTPASVSSLLDLQQLQATLQSPESARAKAMSDPPLFAWTLFINFNWPARLDVRGMPDPNKPFGGPGPVVWQTWKTSQNLYVKPGETPLPWNQGPIYQPPALQSGMIDGKVLTDNNGNPVMYEVRENEDTLNYIIQRNLYTQAGQLKLLQGGSPVSFPYTAMEIKASWRFLGKGDDPSRYLTATVRYDGKERTVGLNGLHITSKILPQWFWCTFEQIDNPVTTPITLKLPIAEDVQLLNKDIQRAMADFKWAYYRLDGVQTADAGDRNAANCIVNPKDSCLANSQIETYFQGSSSCLTCHSTASIGPDGKRYSLWTYRGGNQQGHMGSPPPMKSYVPLDFVWSMREAQ
jgi:hypothetical protein